MLETAWRRYAAATAGREPTAVQLNFVDTPTICRLHADYFGDPNPTDVVTFPLAGPGLFGEIYVCHEVARRQSQRYGVPYEVELARLALHGVLHLLGFDDLRPRPRRRMRGVERRLLSAFFPHRQPVRAVPAPRGPRNASR